jgi:hypothetical protein
MSEVREALKRLGPPAGATGPAQDLETTATQSADAKS